MTSPEVGLRQPPRDLRLCACGLFIDTFADDALRAHAIRIHNELPRHRDWAARQPMSNNEPSFQVRVVQR